MVLTAQYSMQSYTNNSNFKKHLCVPKLERSVEKHVNLVISPIYIIAIYTVIYDIDYYIFSFKLSYYFSFKLSYYNEYKSYLGMASSSMTEVLQMEQE